jgi:exosortase
MSSTMTSYSPFASPKSQTDFPVLPASQQKACWITIGVLIALLALAFLDSILATYQIWQGPQYSYGFLIPIIAAALIYARNEPFQDVPMWHRWVGVGMVALGMVMRVAGGLSTVVFLTNWALVPCLMGIFILVGGLPTMRWAGPAIAFLILMYPFPRIVEEKLMHPLQRTAAACSSYTLTTLGIEAVREQNTIYLGESGQKMDVAAQCSGLRMLTVFTAMGIAVALFLTDRPLWERLLIVISAIPIAVLANVFRITVTGMLFEFLNMNDLNSGWPKYFAHDAAGLVMMPVAMGLFFLEYQILKRLIVDVRDEAGPVSLT